MEIGIGCSLEELNNNKDFAKFKVINIENPLYPGYLEKATEKDIKSINKMTKYRYIVDGAYIDLNPGTSEPKIKDITMQKVIESINFAQEIGAEEVIFLSTFLPFIKVDFYEKGWIEASKKFWEEVLNKYKDIRISLCNTFEFNPDYLIEIVDYVDKGNFGLAFDIGHAILWGQESLVSWFDKIKRYIKTIYLHSNDGEGDLHLSFRQGKLQEKEIKFEELLQQLKGEKYNLILKYFDKSSVIADKIELEKLLGS
ncbi:sugar phosphate isomerase/epimerase family protein [Halothermothrix orenii]|uniref:Xylose isomerase domain protein TIM barrel n=1 Tax=Halothermothrix orenii (strain H 168 / OCM 544 / DSM 9562) TaxID=373903 RepID=B8CXY0_HALOH|nr:TIM barrel protein [Halothermothrix orenii]ACL70149.1 Xylose isomerase domain protein TIM barrel [Halothermothrix orenii H 168]